MSGSDITNHLRYEEGTKTRSLLDVLTVVDHLVLESTDAPDTDAINHSDTVFVDCFEINTAIFDTLYGTDDGQLRVAVELSGFLSVDIVAHVEVFHLAGEMCLAQRAVKLCNGRSSADTCHEILPRLFGCVAHRCNGS